MATLLEIISGDEYGAADKCGVSRPSSLFGSTDPNAPTFIRLANEEGRSLVERHNWRILTVEQTQLTVAAEMQTAFPADFDHLPQDCELWNTSLRLKYLYPTPDDTWQRLKGMGVATAAPGYARLMGDAFQITPAPTAGQTLSYPYIGNKFAASSIGSTKSKFEADTDVPRLPAKLFHLGIIWRWKAAKGFAYAEDMKTYERALETATSRDRGIGSGDSGVISVGKGPSDDAAIAWPGVIT